MTAAFFLVLVGFFFPSVAAFTARTMSRTPSVRITATSLDAIAMDQSSEDGAEQDRRHFLRSAVGFGLTSFMWESQKDAVFAAETEPLDYKAVARDINRLIKGRFTNKRGPTLVRLAWHSSGTYDKMSKTGGSKGGTIRFKEEFEHPQNAGLKQTAIKWLEPIYNKYKKQGLSYADLYTLGGVVAIRALNGPTIPWSSGRVDEMDPSKVTPPDRLPVADSGDPGADKEDAEHLRKIFGRMGFKDQEIVALSGAHALGRCNTKFSGYDGFWTASPYSFNNSYFGFLRSFKWEKRNWDGPFQYETQAGRFMMLPTDIVLLQDEEFSKWVDTYALDGTKFFEDFTKAFQKLEELGTEGLTPTDWYG